MLPATLCLSSSLLPEFQWIPSLPAGWTCVCYTVLCLICYMPWIFVQLFISSILTISVYWLLCHLGKIYTTHWHKDNNSGLHHAQREAGINKHSVNFPIYLDTLNMQIIVANPLLTSYVYCHFHLSRATSHWRRLRGIHTKTNHTL